MISVATAIFSRDTTTSWHLLELLSDQTLGISEVIFLVLVCAIISKGINGIVRASSICEVATLGISVVFTVVSSIILMMQHGRLAEPLTAASLVKSPNSSSTSPFAVVSFIVYALFAYGGLEAMTGVADNVEKPGKAFPRGLIWAMIIMTALYILVIFLCGVAANWSEILGQKNVNLTNIKCALVNNMELVFGKVFGLGHTQALILDKVFSQTTAINDVLGGLGTAFVMLHSPTRSSTEGCDKRSLPEKLTTLDKYDMPEFAMWCKVAFVSPVILLISFGGNSASAFYTVLTDMMSASSAALYLFLIGTLPFFKMKKNLDRPFVFYRSQKCVWVIIASGVIFTIIGPIAEDDPATAFWTAFGPVFFGVIARIFYSRAEKKIKDL